MNTQGSKIKGNINSSVGKVKRAAGQALGDSGLESRGLVQEAKGEAQKLGGAIQGAVEKSAKALGDLVDKVSKKIEHASK